MEVNTSTLGECLGLSRKRVSDLTKEGVLVKVQRGTYDLGESVQGYINWRLSAKKKSKAERTLDEVKAEHEELKMRKTELAVRLMENKIHRADDVKRVWTGMAAAVKSRLLSIPIKAAPQVAGVENIPEVQKLLSREIMEALNEIAEYNPADYAAPLPLEDEEAVAEDEET